MNSRFLTRAARGIRNDCARGFADWRSGRITKKAQLAAPFPAEITNMRKLICVETVPHGTDHQLSQHRTPLLRTTG